MDANSCKFAAWISLLKVNKHQKNVTNRTCYLRILKSAAVLGLFNISLPTRGGVGSERRTAEGLPGRRDEGGDGE